MKIRKEIMELLPEVKHNRRMLHQIPEIGLATIKTKAYLIEQLSGYGAVSYTHLDVYKRQVIGYCNAGS